MHILVLGGAGYIGSHFVKQALNEGHHVSIVDNLQTGHLAAIDQRSRFFRGDIRDKDFLENVFQAAKIDACVHFAANSLVGESVEKPLVYFDNNVTGMIVLLDAMRRHQVQKIVFSSSAAVYGKHDIMPITEDYPTNPTNPYGESKLMMEKMIHWADLAYGIHYVSLRYFNVAGAAADGSIGEVHRPETHLIPIVLQVPLGLRPAITIFGNDYDTSDGTCIRDYVQMDDLVNAHLRALDYLERGHASDVFNLGSGTGFSNLEIVEVARRVTNHPIPITLGARRPGDPDKLVASFAKAKRILGWEPTKTIEETIASAWLFHRTHPQGY